MTAKPLAGQRQFTMAWIKFHRRDVNLILLFVLVKL